MQPKRLTADASDAAARVLSTGPMAARVSFLKPKPQSTATSHTASPPGVRADQPPATADEIELPADEPVTAADEPLPPAEPASIQTEPPPPAAKPTTTRAWEPTPRRHAQASLSEGSRLGFRVALAALLLAALGGGGWWWFFGTPVHPQAAYLPKYCDAIISIKLNEVARIGAAPTRRDLPGLRLIDRCRVFLDNAGLRFDEVERVTAGQTAHGLGTVLVYHLTHPVNGEEIAKRPPFRALRKSDRPTETVRGVPVYSLGTTAIAFPEPQVIVNGELRFVREALGRWTRGVAEPLDHLLQTADLSATSVILSDGASEPIVTTYLPKTGHGTDEVRGSTTSFHYGQTLRLTRILQFDDEQTARDFETSLKSAIALAAKDAKASKNVQELLAQLQISASEASVQIALACPMDQMHGGCLEIVHQLF
jgi:hypothetical protein